MRLKAPKPVPLDRAGAEALAAEAMAAVAGDPARLGRFMASTGMGPADLARAVTEGDGGVLAACLDHVAADESLLLVVAAELRRKPEEIMLARRVMEGEAPETGG